MKTAIALLLAVVTVTLAQVSGRSGAGIHRHLMVGSVDIPHNHPTTPIMFENFEGSPYTLAGWDENLGSGGGTANADNTTNVLSGSQSLALVGVDDEPTYITNSISVSGTVYGYFQFKPLKFPSENVGGYRGVMSLRTAGGSTIFGISMYYLGVFHIFHGIQDGEGDLLDLDQTYHVWFSWTPDNGMGNSVGTLQYSTTKVRPTEGTGTITITSTVEMQDPELIMVGYNNGADEAIGTFGGSVSWIYDYLILDDEQIQNYP